MHTHTYAQKHTGANDEDRANARRSCSLVAPVLRKGDLLFFDYRCLQWCITYAVIYAVYEHMRRVCICTYIRRVCTYAVYAYVHIYVVYVHMNMYVYVHSCMHTYMHACIHAYIYISCMHTYMHTRIHTYSYIHSFIHSWMQALTQRVYVCIQGIIHAYVVLHMRCTHTRVCICVNDVT